MFALEQEWNLIIIVKNTYILLTHSQMLTQIISKPYYIGSTLLIKFYVVLCSRSPKRIPKPLEKVEKQRHLLNDFHQMFIDTNLCQGATKDKVLRNTVYYFLS